MSTAPTEIPVVCAGVFVADHLCTPISHVPAAGELVRADELVLNIGGCASNAAVVLSKLGVRSTVCGRVGDDVFGRYVAETLTSYGVDVARPEHRPRPGDQPEPDRQRPGRGPPVHPLLRRQRGALGRGHRRRRSRSRPRVLYLGGFLILPGLDAVALANALAGARADYGTMIVLDVATPGPADYLRHLRPVLPFVDVFLPNTDEATLILGEPDPTRQALAFRDLGARRVVVTRGERGSVVVSDDLRARLGAYPIEYVDGTGGGDSFDAGYITGLIEGLPELECLKLASAVGASCVRAVGTTAGLFTRSEAAEFIRTHEIAVEPF